MLKNKINPENPDFCTQKKKKKKMPSMHEGKISTFLGKKKSKTREYISSRCVLQEMQKEVFQADGKW